VVLFIDVSLDEFEFGGHDDHKRKDKEREKGKNK
jgi:hypothetical protein